MHQPKVTILQMKNGRWKWQANDAQATLSRFSGPESYILGGGIYGDTPDFETITDAAVAAEKWWNEIGLPHSLALDAEIERKRAQIAKYGRWFPLGQEPKTT